MATASTKSRAPKKKGTPASRGQLEETGGGATAQAATQPSRPDMGDELSRRTWRIACAVLLLVAALVRVFQLELRPMHHDEGVNGFFLTNLIRTHVYRYDPTNYHGPTLYYFALPFAALADYFHAFGTWTVRLVPLIFGMATVWLTLALRRYIGAVGALAAAALLALSPGMVFFSRYFIHEMMFVCFTLGMVVAALRYDERSASDEADRDTLFESLIVLAALPPVVQYAAAIYTYLFKPEGAVAFSVPGYLIVVSFIALGVVVAAYEGVRAIYLILGSLCAALLFATKETAFISVGVLLIAWAMTWGYSTLAARGGWFDARELAGSKRGRGRLTTNDQSVAASGDDAGSGLVARFGGWSRVSILCAAALGFFLALNILFYSSFFTNPKGVTDSLKAFDVWTKTGQSGFHGYGRDKYVQWLVASNKYVEWLVRGDGGVAPESEWKSGEEPLLVLLAGAGALVALWTTRRRFPLFAALWGFGLLAAYSLITYKTPWLALSMLVPFALTGGYALNQLYGRRESWSRPLALSVLGVALAVAAYQTYQLNYVHYDDDKYIYVYAHTRREYLDLLAEVNRVAERAGTKGETTINVAAPEYWPMPWYVRDYKRVGYQQNVSAETNDAVIIAGSKQQAELTAKLGARYQLVGTYPMRPGVTLILFVRRDLIKT